MDNSEVIGVGMVFTYINAIYFEEKIIIPILLLICSTM
jgi:hypothetical protein